MPKPAIILAVLAAAVIALIVLIVLSTHPRRHATTNPIGLALRLGERYWHATPCGGHVRVVRSAAPPAKVADLAINEQVAEAKPDGKALLAWTSFDTPQGPNRIEASPSVYTDCTITLNARLWHSWRTDDGDFQWLCNVMTHELGHLFGHPDEGQTNPASIEYPFIERNSPNHNVVPECRNATVWYRGKQIRSLD